jgi:hypothetical protein
MRARSCASSRVAIHPSHSKSSFTIAVYPSHLTIAVHHRILPSQFTIAGHHRSFTIAGHHRRSPSQVTIAGHHRSSPSQVTIAVLPSHGQMTTRKHRAGIHKVEALINGRVTKLGTFEIRGGR